MKLGLRTGEDNGELPKGSRSRREPGGEENCDIGEDREDRKVDRDELLKLSSTSIVVGGSSGQRQAAYIICFGKAQVRRSRSRESEVRLQNTQDDSAERSVICPASATTTSSEWC